MLVIYIVVFFYVFIFPFMVLCIAEKQGRSCIGWFFLSLLINPIIAILVLIALGDTDKKRKERVIADEMARNSVRNKTENNTHQYDNVTMQQLLDQSRKVTQ